MLKHALKLSCLLAVFCTLLTSCEQQNLTENDAIEDFVNESLFELQSRGNMGRFGCFEIVFPISVLLPDGTSLTVDSYEELKEGIMEWKENNPDVEGKPSFVFPIEVVSDEGELITLANSEELLALKAECPRNFFGGHGHHGHWRKGCFCFKLVFPINIAFPDGTTAEVNDRQEFKLLIRTWKQENPDAEGHPTLVFPIDVEMEDETIVTVNSVEELQALKEDCGG